MEIRTDDLSGDQIARLLLEHVHSAALHSPPESIHALDLEQLRRPDIRFWCAWEGEELLGCIALKQLDAGHAEIKSMRTASAHLRKGVAARLLEHLLKQARQLGYRRLSLETGTAAAFAPARRLYQRFGFAPCAPFGEYRVDPYSTFMCLSLS